MSHLENLEQDLFRSKNRGEIIDILYEIREVFIGNRDYQLSIPSLTKLVNIAISLNEERKYGKYTIDEIIFILCSFSDFLPLERFTFLCKTLIENENTPSIKVARILPLIENHAEIQDDSEIIFMLNDLFHDKYSDIKLINIIKASTNTHLQNTLWLKINKKCFTARSWLRILNEDWLNMTYKIFTDIYNHTKKVTPKNGFTEELVIKLLCLAVRVPAPNQIIFEIIQDLCAHWTKIKKPINLLFILDVLFKYQMITIKNEQGILSRFTKLDPDLDDIGFFKKRGYFIQLENFDTYLLKNYSTDIKNLLSEDNIQNPTILNDDDELILDSLSEDVMVVIYLKYKKLIEVERNFNEITKGIDL